MDFVHDQLATGQKIRVLTVVDTFSRFWECQEFRVRAGIMGTKEISHGPTQRACDS
jgi:hypothetical protein